jgi:hypothetical protein
MCRGHACAGAGFPSLWASVQAGRELTSPLLAQPWIFLQARESEDEGVGSQDGELRSSVGQTKDTL